MEITSTLDTLPDDAQKRNESKESNLMIKSPKQLNATEHTQNIEVIYYTSSEAINKSEPANPLTENAANSRSPKQTENIINDKSKETLLTKKVLTDNKDTGNTNSIEHSEKGYIKKRKISDKEEVIISEKKAKIDTCNEKSESDKKKEKSKSKK